MPGGIAMALPMALVTGVLMFSGVQASDIAGDSKSHGSLSKFMPLRSGSSESSIGGNGKFMSHHLTHMEHGGGPEASLDQLLTGLRHHWSMEEGLRHFAEETPTTPTVDSHSVTYSDNKPAQPTTPTKNTIEFTPSQAGVFRTSKDLKPQKIADKDEDKDLQKLFTNASGAPIGLSAIGVVLFLFAALVATIELLMRRWMQPVIALASNPRHGIDISIPMTPVSVVNNFDLETQASLVRTAEQVLQGSERALAKDMHADIKSPFAMWDSFGLGEAAPEAHVEKFSEGGGHGDCSPARRNRREARMLVARWRRQCHALRRDGHGRHGSTRPRPVLHLAVKHARPVVLRELQHGRAPMTAVFFVSQLDKFDSMAAVMELSKKVRRPVGSGKMWIFLHDLVKSHTSYYRPYQAVQVLYSYAKLARRGLTMRLVPLADLKEAIERVAPDMNSRQVAVTMWAYGVLGIRALPRTATYRTRDTAMSVVPLEGLEEAIVRVAPDMNSQEVAITIWGYGTLRVQPTPYVLGKLEAALQLVVTDVIPQGLSSIIWAYSKFGLRPMPRTLDALKQVAGGLIRKMSPRGVSNTLYGYAALPRTVIYDNRAAAMLDVPLEELEEAIERVVPDMNSQNVANTIYAYGTLGVPPKAQVIRKLEDALRHVVTDLSPQGLSNIIWAYSKFDLRPMPSTLDSLKQVAGGLIRKMDSWGVSNTLYGYATLPRTVTYDNREAAMLDVPLEELEEAIERVAPDMNSQEVANTIWAYGTLGVPPTRRVIDELEEALRHMVMDMISVDVANIIYGYAVLGVPPAPEILDALEAAAERTARDMVEQDVSNILWACAVFDRSPPPAVVEAAGAKADRFTEDALVQCFQAHLAEASAGRHLDLPAELLARAKAAWCNSVGDTIITDLQSDVSGGKLLRNRLLEARGFRVISVPFCEWVSFETDEKKQAYLLKLLDSSAH